MPPAKRLRGGGGTAAAAAASNKSAILFGVVLVMATLIYVTVSYVYVPSLPSGGEARSNAQTFANVGFSAAITLANGAHYIFSQKHKEALLLDTLGGAAQSSLAVSDLAAIVE